MTSLLFCLFKCMSGKITSDEFEVRCVNFNGAYDNSLLDTIVGCEPNILERKKAAMRHLLADATNSVPVVLDSWEENAPRVHCVLHAGEAPDYFRIDFIVPHVLVLYLLADEAKVWEYVVRLSHDGTAILPSNDSRQRAELTGTVISVYSAHDGKKIFHADIAPLIAKFKELHHTTQNK